MDLSLPPIEVPISDHRRFGPNDPHVLWFSDGSLLLWLGQHQGLSLLAMALPDVEGCPWPFLVSAILPAQRRALETHRQTLRACVLGAAWQGLLQDYGAAPPLRLIPIQTVPDNWLPDD